MCRNKIQCKKIIRIQFIQAECYAAIKTGTAIFPGFDGGAEYGGSAVGS